MKRLYLFVCIVFCAFQVSAQDKFITIGTGGGFAGTATTYKIEPTGKVFRGKGVGEIKFTECGKVKKSAAKKMVSAAADMTSANTSFDHPGNLYYFITYSEHGKEQKVTWGDADHPVPDDIKKLFDEIQTSVNAVRYKPLK